MKSQLLPLTEFRHPATFQSRGVAAPFTTPLLAGTRVRHAGGSGIELVVPNPSGGRGAYIVRWPGIRALCNPTLHDRIMVRHLSAMVRIDPAGVRDAALEVALQGHVGPDAAAAAEIARDRDHRQSFAAHFHLLAGVIERMEPDGRMAMLDTQRTPAFERRATNVLHRLGRLWGHPVNHLADSLIRIGKAFAPAGVDRHDQTARIPRLIARLKATHTDLYAWLRAGPDSDIGGLGRVTAASLEMTCASCDLVLAGTQSALADPIALLQQWLADPARVLNLATRTDWLLDGWEHVCLLWLTAGPPPFRPAALLEMAQLMPVMPREVADWVDIPTACLAMDPFCRVISQNDAWRQGDPALALIQRNEALHALRL